MSISDLRRAAREIPCDFQLPEEEGDFSPIEATPVYHTISKRCIDVFESIFKNSKFDEGGFFYKHVLSRVTTAIGGAVITIAHAIDLLVLGTIFGVLSLIALRRSQTLNDLTSTFGEGEPLTSFKDTVLAIIDPYRE